MKRYFMLFMLCATIMLVGCQNGASGSAGGSQAAPTQAAVQPVSEMEKPVPSDGKTISFEKRRGMVDLLNKAGDKKAVRVILGKRVRSVHPEDYGEKSPDIGMNYRPAASGFPRLEEFAVSPDNAAYFAADGALYAKMGDGASGLTAVPMAKKGVLNIAEGTAFIEMQAVLGCGDITRIVIPASVNHISHGAFGGNISCTEIVVDAANADYIAEDGVLYSRDKKILVSYPAGKTGEKFHIPEGVERIDDAAFMENPYLKEVIFSDTVKEVGDAAFQGCSALRTITVNEGLELVEAEAFEKCPKLKKPDIPAKTDLAEEGIF